MNLAIVDSYKFQEKYADRFVSQACIETLASEGTDYHKVHRPVPRGVLTCSTLRRASEVKMSFTPPDRDTYIINNSLCFTIDALLYIAEFIYTSPLDCIKGLSQGLNGTYIVVNG